MFLYGSSTKYSYLVSILSFDNFKLGTFIFLLLFVKFYSLLLSEILYSSKLTDDSTLFCWYGSSFRISLYSVIEFCFNF